MRLLPNLAVIFTFRFLQLVYCSQGDGPVFQTNLGEIHGSVLKSDGGLEFFAFRRIPFAKPPIKELRFKAPQALTDQWVGVLDATEDGPVCVQFNFLEKNVVGDEDCLYLNVYTPKFEEQLPKALPVMVWIHGGAFSAGSGASSSYGPQRLMDKTDIILVSFNYRLGPFGFLSTMDENSPGNYGMLDQVMALKWVRDNIAEFGGNPNQVTIFGESAGASAVGLHVVSPLSKGLFHAAIIQSGSALSDRTIPLDPSIALGHAQNLASLLGCPIDDNKLMMDCLIGMPFMDIAKKSTHLLKKSLNDAGCMLVVFSPVVDKIRGINAFMPDSTVNLMNKKQFNAVPIMAGITKDEGIFFLGFCSDGPDVVASYDVKKLPAFIKASMHSLYKNEKQWNRTSQHIISSYFKHTDEKNITEKTSALNKLFSDSILNYKVDVLNDLFVKYGVPTYAYKLTYRGEHSISENIPNDMVTHADDLQYLFRCSWFKSMTLSDDDKQMSEIMLTLWTNFAKTKVPSLPGSVTEQPDFQWNPTTLDNPNYLDLNLKPTMVDSHLSFNYDIWKNAHSESLKDKPETTFTGILSVVKLWLKNPVNYFHLLKIF